MLTSFQMKWTEVVQDCCEAVAMNPRYVKALFRRAKALEKLDNKKECLEGESRFTEAALAAAAMLTNREPMMPSPQFIKSYFSSFTDDIISQALPTGEKKDEDKDKEGEAAEVTERSGASQASRSGVRGRGSEYDGFLNDRRLSSVSPTLLHLKCLAS
ncbi:Mitochondrial import receptor subunit TOM70 [Liparis tanakae]|uniref:Mitochondrial import receptor subunit TOM70 n=1 Tax=Liparis tanakae TaxID=230148 RepID=A0A4Z2EA03_9TELE|nr:Mitochondrial import receptor subunit TOM70 [Liparis tanakae]